MRSQLYGPHRQATWSLAEKGSSWEVPFLPREESSEQDPLGRALPLQSESDAPPLTTTFPKGNSFLTSPIRLGGHTIHTARPSISPRCTGPYRLRESPLRRALSPSIQHFPCWRASGRVGGRTGHAVFCRWGMHIGAWRTGIKAYNLGSRVVPVPSPRCLSPSLLAPSPACRHPIQRRSLGRSASW